MSEKYSLEVQIENTFFIIFLDLLQFRINSQKFSKMAFL